MASWSDLKIANKLYLVIGTMAVLIACELFTLRFAMRSLSAVRAFVEGEAIWSKAQKDAALALQRYAATKSDADFRDFLGQLTVQDGDHAARIEMLKPDFDREVARRGFLQGGLHPDDIDGTIDFLRRFYWQRYVARAIDRWTRGDELISEFRAAGIDLRREMEKGDEPAVGAALARVRSLNAQLTEVEAGFSAALGEGSRWLERVVITLLMLAVLTVEAVGLSLTFRTTRALSRGLSAANQAAARIGRGDFDAQVQINSKDELGELAEAINQMGALLKSSYGELEERVAERTAAATSALQLRDEFLSIASHELRTPLTALNLQLQLLHRKLDEPAGSARGSNVKLTDAVDQCIAQGRRLARLSDELMDLTQIRLGKLEMHREKCDLAALVREAAGSLAAEASKAGSELHVSALEPLEGPFDPARIGQVVTNLVSNAIKYGRARPIDVEVARRDGRAVLRVRDEGIGIEASDQQRIFDRFERAQKDKRIAGLGLGLYVTKQIVDRHGGRISVESEQGKGSTFLVELPLSA